MFKRKRKPKPHRYKLLQAFILGAMVVAFMVSDQSVPPQLTTARIPNCVPAGLLMGELIGSQIAVNHFLAKPPCLPRTKRTINCIALEKPIADLGYLRKKPHV
jgi:hypothetical protein